MGSRLNSALAVALTFTLGGPAVAEQLPEQMEKMVGPGKVAEGFFPGGTENYIKDCRQKFADVDKRIEDAGAREASYFQVPGFPYLRSSRLTALMIDDLDSPEKYETWIYQLRDNDGFSREIELINLGVTGAERFQTLSDLRTCAVWLSTFELDDPRGIKKLFSAVQVPDERGQAYIKNGKLPGQKSWPGKPPALNPEQQKLILPEASSDVNGEDVVGRWEKYLRDDLGRIGMTPSEQLALAELYAPTLLLENREDNRDHPGGLRWKGSKLVVDGKRAVIYFHPSFARINFETHLQLNYIAFFSENGQAGEAIDSIIWRVTLDSKGKPMVYDSVHGAGGDHQWFPAQDMGVRDARDGLPSPKIPQGLLDSARLAVQLHDQPYHVGQVYDADKLEGYALENYALQRYEDLFLLPVSGADEYGPGDETRSVFNGDGVMVGVAGQKQARARQFGYHDLGSASDLHFDDPTLIERLFTVHKLAAAEQK